MDGQREEDLDGGVEQGMGEENSDGQDEENNAVVQ